MPDTNPSCIDIIGKPITLPCGLRLPNRLVKCPMQETQAKPPDFDPPTETFKNLYTQWAQAQCGLIITGQVQIDIRFHQMRRLGRGLKSDPDLSILRVLVADVVETFKAGSMGSLQRLLQTLPLFRAKVE